MILVLGSVALDSVETPAGKVVEALGGAATYFSVAASLYCPVNLVGAVGKDFPQEYTDFLRSRPIDLDGLQILEGRTLRWAGRYSLDLDVVETLDIQINVSGTFHPILSERYKASPLVFLANIDPLLQYEVVIQVNQAQLKVMDTARYWIANAREQLAQTISAVDIVLMNDAEVRQYSGNVELYDAARVILEQGPMAVIIKQGNKGAILFARDGTHFSAPSYPVSSVIDPTGAGDSFAGGFMGYLATVSNITLAEIKKAIIHGSIMGSYAVENFGLEGLKTVTPADIAYRYQFFVDERIIG
jgi:sugar/nucleoside kinase (ribokinase family)